MPRKLFLIALATALGATSQSNPDKIWEGVFTAAQADRGREAYLKSCTNCHNLDLSGSVRGPSLRGARFLLAWQNGSVNNLFLKIRDTMPANYPESVADPVKLDVITYLLKENGFPTGPAELKLQEETLESIQIVQKGSRGVPNFALVQVVGCLQGEGKTWVLTQATEPVATREDAPPASASLLPPLGSQTFVLVSAAGFNPASHVGQKMEARGLLYRDAGGNRLNLTSLQMAESACPK